MNLTGCVDFDFDRSSHRSPPQLPYDSKLTDEFECVGMDYAGTHGEFGTEEQAGAGGGCGEVGDLGCAVFAGAGGEGDDLGLA